MFHFRYREYKDLMMLLLNGSMSVVCALILNRVLMNIPQFDNLYAEFSEWCSNNEEDKLYENG